MVNSPLEGLVVSLMTANKQALHLKAVELNGQSADQQSRHGAPEPRFGAGDRLFALFAEEPTLAEPREGALDLASGKRWV